MLTIVVQVNGKLRSSIDLPNGVSKEEVLGLCKKIPKIDQYLKGKTIIKEIYIPGKLVNLVIKWRSYTDYLLTEAKDKKLISVDLKEQKITTENKTIINFDVDSFRKKCLLEGLDDIALTMKNSKKIDIYEEKVIKSKSWLTL
mgnify:CR=1 FL=1